MTINQRQIFSLLYSTGPLCIGDVARRLYIDADTVHKAVLALEGRGLLRSCKQGRQRVCTVATWVLM